MPMWFEDDSIAIDYVDSEFVKQSYRLIAEEWLTSYQVEKLQKSIMDNTPIFADDGSKWYVTLISPTAPTSEQWKGRIFTHVEMKLTGPPGRALPSGEIDCEDYPYLMEQIQEQKNEEQ